MKKQGSKYAKNYPKQEARPPNLISGPGIREKAKAAKTPAEKAKLAATVKDFKYASDSTKRLVKRLCGPVSTPKRKRGAKRA